MITTDRQTDRQSASLHVDNLELFAGLCLLHLRGVGASGNTHVSEHLSTSPANETNVILCCLQHLTPPDFFLQYSAAAQEAVHTSLADSVATQQARVLIRRKKQIKALLPVQLFSSLV